MTDYYPILARAVAGLPKNDAQARQDIYERARTFIAEQLHSQGRQKSATEVMREQAALEVAIRKVEAESRSAKPRMTKVAPPAPPEPHAAAVMDGVAQTKNAAKYLARILQELQPGQGREKGAETRPRSKNIDSSVPTKKTGEDLGGMPNSLGGMLLILTYIVGAMAFTGVIYIRGLVWVIAGVLPYPLLLLVTAIVIFLFMAPPVAIIRKIWSLPSIGVLFRFIYTASRRVF